GAAVLGGQLGGEPSAVGRRGGADVGDDVEGGASRAADELDLGARVGLEVQAAQGAGAAVVRDVALHPGGVQAVLGELVEAPGAGEAAALVVVRLGLD